MRLLVSLAVILAALVGVGFWTIHSLQASTDELTRQIDRISIEIREDQWEAAVKQTESMEKTWGKNARWWPIFLDHQEMDNIEFSLAKVKEYVSSRNTALSMGQLSELRLMVEHIPRKEAVNLENIL